MPLSLSEDDCSGAQCQGGSLHTSNRRFSDKFRNPGPWGPEPWGQGRGHRRPRAQSSGAASGARAVGYLERVAGVSPAHAPRQSGVAQGRAFHGHGDVCFALCPNDVEEIGELVLGELGAVRQHSRNPRTWLPEYERSVVEFQKTLPRTRDRGSNFRKRCLRTSDRGSNFRKRCLRTCKT